MVVSAFFEGSGVLVDQVSGYEFGEAAVGGASVSVDGFGYLVEGGVLFFGYGVEGLDVGGFEVVEAAEEVGAAGAFAGEELDAVH